MNRRNIYVAIIVEAVRNKYRDFDEQKIKSFIDGKFNEYGSLKKYGELFKLAIPINGIKDDCHNQVLACCLIENIWSKKSNISLFNISILHGVLMGVRDSIDFRRSPRVEGFDDNIPVHYCEIPSRLDELESNLQLNLTLLSDSSIQIKSIYLSYLFSSIIRIHPFKDGNGRTARMLVQYLLACWNMDPIVLPKVRNNRKWKIALQNGLKGNYIELASEFAARINGKSHYLNKPDVLDE